MMLCVSVHDFIILSVVRDGVQNYVIHFMSPTHSLIYCSSYRLTNTDQRLGSIVTWTIPKWNTLFERCRKNLGFQPNPLGDSDNSLSFWNYWHLVSSQHEKSATPPIVRKTQNKHEVPHLKRANSLPIRFKRDSSKSDKKGVTLRDTKGDINNSYQHSPLTITKTVPISTSPDNDRLRHLMKDYLEKVRCKHLK